MPRYEQTHTQIHVQAHIRVHLHKWRRMYKPQNKMPLAPSMGWMETKNTKPTSKVVKHNIFTSVKECGMHVCTVIYPECGTEMSLLLNYCSQY